MPKEKNGNVEKRPILDLERSGTSQRTRKTHRVTLPRHSDLVRDILQLLATKSPEQDVELVVLDFSDAFWQIRLALKERRHFIGFDGQIHWEIHTVSTGVKEWTTLVGWSFVSVAPMHARSLHGSVTTHHKPGCSRTPPCRRPSHQHPRHPRRP